MNRIPFLLILSVLFIHSSCKQCTQCNYTYTKTTINQTPNGEEEVVTTHTGYILNEDGAPWTEECVKSDETPSIQAAYEAEAEVSTLPDFTVNCVDK